MPTRVERVERRLLGALLASLAGIVATREQLREAQRLPDGNRLPRDALVDRPAHVARRRRDQRHPHDRHVSRVGRERLRIEPLRIGRDPTVHDARDPRGRVFFREPPSSFHRPASQLAPMIR